MGTSKRSLLNTLYTYIRYNNPPNIINLQAAQQVGRKIGSSWAQDLASSSSSSSWRMRSLWS
jgi:hypothetical protein